MPETQSVSIDSSRFRTSRFPGFRGGRTNSAGNLALPSDSEIAGVRGTGGLESSGTSASPQSQPQTGGAANDSGPSSLRSLYATDNYGGAEPVSKPGLGDYARAAAPGVGSYVGSQIGEKGFSGFMGGISESLSGVGERVGSMFGSTAAPAAGEAVGGLVGTASGDVAGGLAGDLVGEAAGEIAGSAAGEAGAAVAGEAAGEAGSAFGGFGGAAGAGIGSAIGTLVATGDVGQAAKSGVATGAGYALGNAILPGVGGFIGGALGGAIGGRVICTELRDQGLMSQDLLDLDLHFTARIHPTVIRGYHAWAIPFVRLMRRSELATAIVKPFAVARALEIAYQLGAREVGSPLGKLVRWIGEPACFVIGLFVGASDWKGLYPKETAR